MAPVVTQHLLSAGGGRWWWWGQRCCRGCLWELSDVVSSSHVLGAQGAQELCLNSFRLNQLAVTCRWSNKHKQAQATQYLFTQ